MLRPAAASLPQAWPCMKILSSALNMMATTTYSFQTAPLCSKFHPRRSCCRTVHQSPAGFKFVVSSPVYRARYSSFQAPIVHSKLTSRSGVHRDAVVVRPVAASAAVENSDSNMTGNDHKHMKVVGVFYKAHEYAKDPKFLGCVENGLGLKEFLESKGHTYIVTDDKEGDNCELEKHIPDMDVLITTPFHPAYMTAERIKKAKNLKLILTAGVGSDHVDLHAAAEKGLTVAEVSGSNVVSVAEDELMRILILIRNFLPAWKQISEGGWNVAAVAYKAFDLQGKTVGTVGSGRIGQELLKRLKAFDCNLLYYARHQMSEEKEKVSGARWEKDLDKFLAACDVVSINIPLSDKTRGMFNKEVLGKMKKGAMLVNNARGAIVDVDAVKEACESGQLGGYSGDVWYPQPPPKDHCWRYMPNQGMTPHISGTTIDAQARYAEGVKEMLEEYFTGKPLPEENYIVREGELSSQYT